jgi:hypothetical protein
MTNIGFDYVIEYQKEGDTAYKMMGRHYGFKLGIENKQKEVSYLPDAQTDDAFECTDGVTVGKERTFSTSAYIADPAVLADFYISASNAITPFNFGIINKRDGTYRKLTGVVPKSVVMSVKKDDIVEMKVDFNAKHVEPASTTDYAPDAHATLPNNFVQYTDLDSVTYNGVALSVSNLDLKIEYTLKSEEDLAQDESAYFITGRKITASLTVDDLVDSIEQAVLNDTAADLVFVLAGKTFTLQNVKIPKFELDVQPEELIGQKIETTRAKKLIIS